MRLLCGYGEKPERVVISAIVVVFGLTIVYIFGGLNLAYAIYFCAVSFTALGYGSWAPTPVGWIQGLGAVEPFLGVFMMALFLVTFIRKMTR
ncbi:ion channel [Chloroflexota bacterium]